MSKKNLNFVVFAAIAAHFIVFSKNVLASCGSCTPRTTMSQVTSASGGSARASAVGGNATGGNATGGSVNIGDINVDISPSYDVGDVSSSVGDVMSTIGDVNNNSGNSTIGDVNNHSGNSTVYNNPTVSPTNTLSQTQGQDQNQSQNQQQYNNQNQANSQTNTQNMTYNESDKMHYSGGYEIKSVPDSYAPPAMSTGTCLKAYSGGASWMGGALSLGGVIEDKECTRRATAGRMAEMGYRKVGFEVMCGNREVYEASKRAGVPCKYNPKFENKPQTSSTSNELNDKHSEKLAISARASILDYDF